MYRGEEFDDGVRITEIQASHAHLPHESLSCCSHPCAYVTCVDIGRQRCQRRFGLRALEFRFAHEHSPRRFQPLRFREGHRVRSPIELESFDIA